MSRATRSSSVVLVLLLMVFASAAVEAATVRDRFEQSWTVTEGGRLDLSNENGSVEIQSWDRSEVRVRAEIRLKAASSRAAEEAMEEFRVRASQEGNVITVSSRKPRGADGFLSWLAGKQIEVDVDYEIMVPQRFDIDVETVNGSIEAKSLAGVLELDSVNGRIAVRNARGSVSADTVNGSIEVELVDVANAGGMTFGTTNGSVTLSLPADAGADFDAATTNGRISSDIPLTTESVSRSKVRGTLNGGGVPIKVRTVNGSIKILAS